MGAGGVDGWVSDEEPIGDEWEGASLFEEPDDEDELDDEGEDDEQE